MSELKDKLAALVAKDPDAQSTENPVGAPAEPQGNVPEPSATPEASQDLPAAIPSPAVEVGMVKVRAEGQSFGVAGVEYLVVDGIAEVPADCLEVLAGHGIFPVEE